MTTLAAMRSWKETAMSFLYPEVCQICKVERAVKAEGYVCEHCWQEVRFVTAPFCERCGLPFDGDITSTFECTNCADLELHFSSARSAVKINNLVRDVIHQYKYTRKMWFEPFLAGLLIHQAKPVFASKNYDLIVPVPLYPARQREREFNQAERLARQLGKATGVLVNTGLIERVKSTETQTHLSRHQRATNMEKAFAPKPGARLNGESVVVLDDVFTTGATTNACARVLLAAGAGEVCVWTVARGL